MTTRRFATPVFALMLLIGAAAFTAAAPASVADLSVLGDAVRPPRSINDIAFRGNILYVATQSGVGAYDCSDPTAPKDLGFAAAPAFDTVDSGTYLAVVGDYLLSGQRWNGFTVFKLDSSGKPLYVSRTPSGLGQLCSLITVNDHMAVSVEESGGTWKAIVYGHKAGSDDFGLVSSVQFPFSEMGPTCKLALVGGYLYALVLNKNLYRIDLSDPAAPGKPELLMVDQTMRNIAAVSDSLAVGRSSHRLSLYSEVDGKPTPLGTLTVAGGNGGGFEDIYVNENRVAFKLDGWIFCEVDVSNPREPYLVAISGTGPTGGLFNCAISGDLAAAVQGHNRLLIMRRQDSDFALTATIDFPDRMRFLVTDGARLALAGGFESLAVYDLIDPEKPELRQSVVLGDQTSEAVFALGSLFGVASGYKGVYLLDPEDGSEARILTDNQPRDAVAHGNFLYTWNDREGFAVRDLSRPGAPKLIGALPLQADYRDLAVGDKKATLLANRLLYIIDLAVPAKPTIESQLYLKVDCRSVNIIDGVAYLCAGGQDGILKVDLSKPVGDREVEPAAASSELDDVWRVTRDGAYWVVAGGRHGLILINPKTMLSKRLALPYVVDVIRAGDYLYALSSSDGLFVLGVKK